MTGQAIFSCVGVLISLKWPNFISYSCFDFLKLPDFCFLFAFGNVIGDVSLTSMRLNSILKSFPGWHHLEVSPCQPCFFVKAVIFASYICFWFLRSSQTLFPSQAFSILKTAIICFLCPLWFPYSNKILFPYCIFSFIKTARICFPKPALVSLEWPNFVSFTSFWFP